MQRCIATSCHILSCPVAFRQVILVPLARIVLIVSDVTVECKCRGGYCINSTHLLHSRACSSLWEFCCKPYPYKFMNLCPDVRKEIFGYILIVVKGRVPRPPHVHIANVRSDFETPCCSTFGAVASLPWIAVTCCFTTSLLRSTLKLANPPHNAYENNIYQFVTPDHLPRLFKCTHQNENKSLLEQDSGGTRRAGQHVRRTGKGHVRWHLGPSGAR